MRRDRIRRWCIAASILLPLFYLPYVWLFFEDGSLIDVALVSGYRGWWLRHYPVLPGLIPELLTRWIYENETLMMSIYMFALVGASLWIGSRGRRSLIVIAALAGLYGVWAFLATQAIYAM